MDRNDLPRIIGTSHLRITKSIGNMNVSNFTRRSYKISTSIFTVQATISRYIDVDLGSSKPNYWNTANDIRLMLALKSHKALAKLKVPIVHGIVIDPGSSFFLHKRMGGNCTPMVQIVCRFETHSSLLSHKIFHELRITSHLLQIFNQRDIYWKMLQHKDELVIFHIFNLLHQSLREG